jgi:type IX secretion system PorP/SprF family membrane protein
MERINIVFRFGLNTKKKMKQRNWVCLAGKALTGQLQNTRMKNIILLLFLACNLTAYAQQDPLFTQYLFNKLLVNPAYAGSKEAFALDIADRSQWVNIDGAPRTFTISAHSAIRNKNVGLGVYFFREGLGPTNNQGIMGTYAYRINMDNCFLAFGLQLGLKYFDFDWSKMKLKDPDYLFDTQDVRRITPDANFGIYFQSRRMFLGLSSKQLLENEYGFSTSKGKTSFSKLTRHFYMMGGYAFPLAEKITFRPSVMAKYDPIAPWQLDLNASLLFGDILWVGASYRNVKVITFLTEVKISERVKIGYSYDLFLNELLPFNYGSHEIRMRFEIPQHQSRMRTPRYF